MSEIFNDNENRRKNNVHEIMGVVYDYVITVSCAIINVRNIEGGTRLVVGSSNDQPTNGEKTNIMYNTY